MHSVPCVDGVDRVARNIGSSFSAGIEQKNAECGQEEKLERRGMTRSIAERSGEVRLVTYLPRLLVHKRLVCTPSLRIGCLRCFPDQ